MTGTCRTWLPGDVLERADVHRSVREIVDAWASIWFASRPFADAEIHAGSGDPPAPGGLAKPFVTLAEPEAAERLAMLACGILDDLNGLAGGDRRLLKVVGERILSDLDTRLTQELGEDASGADGYLEIRLGQKSVRPIVRILISGAAVTRMVKSLIGPSATPGPAARPMREGLADTTVSLKATLGRANLSFGDLRGLAVGDVLVLDTSLDGAVELSLDPASTPVAFARLSQDEDRLTLVVQA